MMTKRREAEPALISSFSAAEILDAPHSYIVRMARRKVVPHYRLPDGEIRFDRDELYAWIRGQRVDNGVET